MNKIEMLEKSIASWYVELESHKVKFISRTFPTASDLSFILNVTIL